MGQKLCEKCHEIFKECMDDGDKIALWVHCHHEEEKKIEPKPCNACDETPEIKWGYSTDVWHGYSAKYCPECGRRLPQC